MALQISTTTLQGFTAPDAYARIVSYNGNKNTVQTSIEIHKDIQAKDNGLYPISNFNIALEFNGGATMQEMYNALKLLPEFAGAIDV